MVDYYIDHVLGDQGGFEKDRDSFRKAVAFIKHIENVVDRNLFIKRVSEKLGIDQELLKKEISRARPAVTDDGTIRGVYTAAIEKLELDLIHLLLIHPEKIVPVTQTGILDYFTNMDLKNFGETLQSAAAGLQPWDAVERVSRLDPGPIREGLIKKLMEERPLEEEKILDRLIVDTTRQIRRRWYKEKHKKLKMDIVKAQETGDADLCSRLLAEKDRLLREEKMLGI
jgi:DNA primase